MTQSPWWAFDGLDDEDEQDTQLDTHEKTALDAIRAIAALADADPAKGLMVGASLRKIATVSQSKSMSLGLRSITVRR